MSSLENSKPESPAIGPHQTEFVNLSTYKFVELQDLPQRRKTLLDCAERLGMKGTVLLSPEGINMFL